MMEKMELSRHASTVLREMECSSAVSRIGAGYRVLVETVTVMEKVIVVLLRTLY